MNLQELESVQKKLFHCTDEDLNIFYKQSNLTKSEVEDILQIIKDWYNQQEHLPKDALDDQMILRFFFGCKCSIERAKEKIENFITIRSAAPEFYTNRDPSSPEMVETMHKAPFAYIPELTDEFHRVVCYSEVPDQSPSNGLGVYRALLMQCDMRMRWDVAFGDITVIDCKNISISRLKLFTPVMIKKLIVTVQKCYCLKIKGIYFLNLPSYAVSIVPFIKSLLTKKIADRIQICSCLEELHKKIDPKYLPIELGGSKYTKESLKDSIIEAMQSDYWVKWFKLSEVLLVDESKRRDKSSNKVDQLTGMMGSFRKLDID